MSEHMADFLTITGTVLGVLLMGGTFAIPFFLSLEYGAHLSAGCCLVGLVIVYSAFMSWLSTQLWYG